MNLENELEKLGFSDKESKVYLALLELGHDSVQQISKKAQINRATTYFILESLQEMGVIGTYEQGKKTHYTANDPSSLKNYLANKEHEIQKQSERLEELMPQLNSIHNIRSDKPTIKFFDGEKAVMQSMRELYSNLEESDKVSRLFFPKHKVDEIGNKKIGEMLKSLRSVSGFKTRLIYTNKDGVVEDTGYFEDVFIDESKYPISIIFEVLNDKIQIATVTNPDSSVLIHNKEIAESFKSIFELAWIGAKHIEGKKKK